MMPMSGELMMRVNRMPAPSWVFRPVPMLMTLRSAVCEVRLNGFQRAWYFRHAAPNASQMA